MSEWVSVADANNRAPLYEDVLTYRGTDRRGNHVFDVSARYSDTEFEGNFGGNGPITHWMPLPTPPEKENG